VYNHFVGKHVIRISEAEAAATNVATLLARVRAGAEIVIENDARPVAVLHAAEPVRRTISECIALLPEDSAATIDPDFSKDVEAAIASHREPLDPPAWDLIIDPPPFPGAGPIGGATLVGSQSQGAPCSRCAESHLNTDSYKLTHWWQYPPDTRHIYSYLESRGGMFGETMLAMLQYIIKSNFAGQVFTLNDVEEARRIATRISPAIPRLSTTKVLNLSCEARRPTASRIRAVKEGTVVKTHNALITIENTDPEFYWLTNWAETLLVQVWYPITVATLVSCDQAGHRQSLVRTGDPSLLPFKLHDFGFRASLPRNPPHRRRRASPEFSRHGHACRHSAPQSVLFADLSATDPTNCAAYSIPASEHSTITAWGEAQQLDAYANILENCPEGLVAWRQRFL